MKNWESVVGSEPHSVAEGISARGELSSRKWSLSVVMNKFCGMEVAETAENAVVNRHLLATGFNRLERFLKNRSDLSGSLDELAGLGGKSTRSSAIRLKRKVEEFEPSVTFIGQVKAGKTTLVNAMVGRPGLLPADVNPWTSVVTSLHLDPHPPKQVNTAVFRFFEEDEWSRLLAMGGRLGELASRAGAQEEMEKVRQQVEAMREKSRVRLGRRFELLLGQEHEYGSFDEQLIERYVCLGDDFGEDDGTMAQGRFADITKSADLYMHRPEIPLKLCLRDTPGVNDTFMMREQITIGAIRESRICVVVLSAHQALSTVDMALVRLISNIQSREVIIFINRIDELPDPARQIPEIREAVHETLRKHDGPADAQIIFGSAYWATHALTDTLHTLSSDSAESLIKLAESELEAGADAESSLDLVWRLSGVPALYEALSERISEGAGREVVEGAARQASNLAKALQARSVSSFLAQSGKPKLRMDEAAIRTELRRIEAGGLRELEEEFSAAIEAYHLRLERCHRNFLDRAALSLISHLEENGDQAIWSYEPDGLRLLLRSAYQVFGARVQSLSRQVFESTAAEIGGLYRRAFDIERDFDIDPPQTPRVPPPVVIGQTIALDIKGNWWRNWWRRRRGYHTYTAEFSEMIRQETDPIIQDLKATLSSSVRLEAAATLREFIAEQRAVLLSVTSAGATATPGSEDWLARRRSTQVRLQAIEGAMASMTRDAA